MAFPIITRSLADTGDTLAPLNQCWLTPARTGFKPTGYHGDPHMTQLTVCQHDMSSRWKRHLRIFN